MGMGGGWGGTVGAGDKPEAGQKLPLGCIERHRPPSR